MKSNGSMWPTVIWRDSQLLVYYLGENEDDVKVRETREINFDEFFLHLDNGGSVFVTTKPGSGLKQGCGSLESEQESELLQDFV